MLNHKIDKNIQMSIIIDLYGALFTEISRIITGQLFSEKQINTITSHAVGRYFSGLFPDSEDEREAREKVDEAKEHIIKASHIISEMKYDLDLKTENLDSIILEIENKKALAERYEALANTSQEKFSAFKTEMEDVLRGQLLQHSDKGKGQRRFISIVITITTLIIGAGLGAYFKDIVALFGTTGG